MRAAVEKIALDISEGRSFARALSEHETIFPSTYVNLIAASETGGFMYEVLQQLLDMDAKREKMRTTLMSAATYPMFLIVFSRRCRRVRPGRRVSEVRHDVPVDLRSAADVDQVADGGKRHHSPLLDRAAGRHRACLSLLFATG